MRGKLRFEFRPSIVCVQGEENRLEVIVEVVKERRAVRARSVE